MIFIGYTDQDKKTEIERYRINNDIRKIVVISADEFPLSIPGTDQVKYSDVIMYVTFYRLLQEIDQQTLVVINECLRTQNRYDLTYNCIRNFLNQTSHQLIFQQLPQIDTCDDFMILFDFDTRSRWKRQKFDINLILDNTKVCIKPLPVSFSEIKVPTSEKTIKQYAKERKRRFGTIGLKDPHTIPRNLHLIGGVDKLAYIQQCNNHNGQLSFLADENQQDRIYVARNQRLNSDQVVTYQGISGPIQSQIALIDLPHRFIDFSDFIKKSGQCNFEVLVTDLKVDHWYFNRYQEWRNRLNETYANLQQQ